MFGNAGPATRGAGSGAGLELLRCAPTVCGDAAFVFAECRDRGDGLEVVVSDAELAVDVPSAGSAHAGPA
ncbi:MAG TPA: hypothetical protein PLE49_17115 [Mycobacterium sp.]|nr:hypothetical protein [Mycobacterium sp.]